MRATLAASQNPYKKSLDAMRNPLQDNFFFGVNFVM
jgi:hypothetical protein